MSIIYEALKKVEGKKNERHPASLPAGAEANYHITMGKLTSPLLAKNLVGIDIGFSSVKAVSLKRGRGGCCLMGAGYEKIHPGTGDTGIVDALRALVRKQKIGSGKVTSTMPFKTMVFSHEIMLPKMPEPDLREAVAWEVKKEIDFPGDAVIDYVVNNEVVDGGRKKLSIIAFAVKRAEVLEHMNMLKKASLKPYAIDVCPMAFLSAFDYNYGWGDNKRYAIIDIGSSQTCLTILYRQSVRLARQISLAGNDMTWTIQDAEETDFESAEEEKIRYTAALDDAPKIVQNAARLFMEKISAEIMRSLVYYQAQMREGSVDHILLSGGCARIKGLAGYIEKTVGVPTSVYDIMRGLRLTKEMTKSPELFRLSPLLVEAFGLALRRRGE